jgi:RNA polymerase sigma-70 factor (ECF subfamily)
MAHLLDTFRSLCSVEPDEAELEQALLRVHEAYPRVQVEDEAFVTHLARHVQSNEELAALHVGDLYLALGAVLRDRVAVATLDAQYLLKVPEYIVRIRVGKHVVDDVVQRVRERLLVGDGERGPRLLEYAGRGALAGWIRVMASRTALNHLRSERHDGELGDEQGSILHDPELAYMREHARAAFVSAFRQVLANMHAGQRTLLRLHYIEGLTMDQLSVMYKMPRSTIARRVAEARSAVLDATCSLLREQSSLGSSSVESLIRAAHSHVDLTISRLL